MRPVGTVPSHSRVADQPPDGSTSEKDAASSNDHRRSHRPRSFASSSVTSYSVARSDPLATCEHESEQVPVCVPCERRLTMYSGEHAVVTPRAAAAIAATVSDLHTRFADTEAG